IATSKPAALTQTTATAVSTTPAPTPPHTPTPIPTPTPTTAPRPAPTSVAVRQPNSLVLTATGDAGIKSITYVVDGHTVTVSSVHLPWRVTLNVPANGAKHTYSATIVTASGDVKLLAIVNGAVQSTSSGGGTGSGTVDVVGDFVG